jgi:hypothetical protein
VAIKKLKFPIIRGPMPKKKWLSMDDYLRFVEFNLKNTFIATASREWKRMMAVDVPFLIRST